MSDVLPRGPIIGGDGGGSGGGGLLSPGIGNQGPAAPIGDSPKLSGIAQKPPAPPPSWPVAPKSAGRLWMRKWKLTIGNQSGDKALDLSLLAFNFEVMKQLYETAWHLQITIFNINDTVLQGLQKQYTNIRLEAGYIPPSQQYGVIFAGPIAWFKAGRLNATDSFVEVHAMCADDAITQGIINTTLPAGSTPKDVVLACVSAMSPYGIGVGYLTALGDQQSPRARTLFGHCRDILRDVARTAGANYHIDDDKKLHMLKEAESFATEQVPVLNWNSGLLDVPTMMDDGGIQFRCLLNFAIRPGRRVRINNRDMIHGYLGPSGGADQMPTIKQNLEMQQSLAFHSDGLYVVGKAIHSGENRGNAWFTTVITMPVTPTGVATPQVTTGA